MANIAITSKCNLNCSYCFAQAEFSDNDRSQQHMSLSVFQKALDFIHRSNIHQIRILGGEPTLHPQFIEFMELALNTGLPIRLFSNGMMPKRVLNYLSDLHADQAKLTIVLNMTRLESTPGSGLEQVFDRLSDKVMPGYNYYHIDCQPGFIPALIEKHGLQKKIRLGIAHPCAGYDNAYISARYFRYAGAVIADLAKNAKSRNIYINLDCGFTPCMFDGYDIEQLGLDIKMGLHCEPILDILPNGDIIPCYALSNQGRLSLNDGATADDLRPIFYGYLGPFAMTGIYKDCDVCDYRLNGQCNGGGVCHKISRFNKKQR